MIGCEESNIVVSLLAHFIMITYSVSHNFSPVRAHLCCTANINCDLISNPVITNMLCGVFFINGPGGPANF